MDDPGNYNQALRTSNVATATSTGSYDWNEFSSAVPAAGTVAARLPYAVPGMYPSAVPGVYPSASMAAPVAPSNTRRVQFHEARVVGVVAPISSLSQQEKDNLWYTPSALDNFKCQVRSMCRKLRHATQGQHQQQQQQQQQHHQHQLYQPTLDATYVTTSTIPSSSRGLEHRVCPKRQRNKQLALRCVLKAQKRSSCPDFLANVSSNCTFWARQLAEDEGSKDFQEAYSAEDNKEMFGGGINTAPIEKAAPATTKKCILKQRVCPILSKLKAKKQKAANEIRGSDNISAGNNDIMLERTVPPIEEESTSSPSKMCILSKLTLCPAKRRACESRGSDIVEDDDQRHVRRKEF
eukprot:scaffold9345_cov120-Cylindrotheca_fusiformis.AAC.6